MAANTVNAYKQKNIERVDGAGELAILPARDVAGSHGKTYLFIGFDEIHGYRSWDIFEALAPDPSRLFFSWYAADFATDAALDDVDPARR